MDTIADLLPGLFAALTTGLVTLAKAKARLKISPQVAAALLALFFALLIHLFETTLSPEMQELIITNAIRIFALQLAIYEVFIGKRGLASLFAKKSK